MYAINPANYSFGTVCPCRIPNTCLKGKQIENPANGCRGCASGEYGFELNIFGNKYGEHVAAIQIAREERQSGGKTSGDNVSIWLQDGEIVNLEVKLLGDIDRTAEVEARRAIPHASKMLRPQETTSNHSGPRTVSSNLDSDINLNKSHVLDPITGLESANIRLQHDNIIPPNSSRSPTRRPVVNSAKPHQPLPSHSRATTASSRTPAVTTLAANVVSAPPLSPPSLFHELHVCPPEGLPLPIAQIFNITNYPDTFRIDWNSLAGTSKNKSIQLELQFAPVCPPGAQSAFHLYYFYEIEQTFCFQMHQIVTSVSEQNISAENRLVAFKQQVREILDNQYYRIIRLRRRISPQSWDMTESCGLCGYRAAWQMERRNAALLLRPRTIPQDFSEINYATRHSYSPDFNDANMKQTFAADMYRRSGEIGDPLVTGIVNAAAQFLLRNRTSNTKPFMPSDSGGWFESQSMSTKWQRCGVYPELIVGFCHADTSLEQEGTFGYVTQSTLPDHEGDETTHPRFNLNDFYRIVMTGNFINFSGTHFAIEPMVNALVELDWLEEAKTDLINSIAMKLVRYYDYLQLLNEMVI